MKYFESFLAALVMCLLLAIVIGLIVALGPFVFAALWIFGLVWAGTHIAMNKD